MSAPQVVEDLPDELLIKIAKLTASAYNSDFRLFDAHHRDPEVGVPRIECRNAGVQFLSATNSRLRRLCQPVLFSSIVVVSGAQEMWWEEFEEEEVNPFLMDKVHPIFWERLPMLLEKRPHVGRLIR